MGNHFGKEEMKGGATVSSPLKKADMVEIDDNNQYDYIVVGLGAAGSVIAARLAEDPNLKIAVIESGGDYTKNPNVSTPAKHLLLWGPG